MIRNLNIQRYWFADAKEDILLNFFSDKIRFLKNSSISEATDYPKLCKQAVLNDEIFENFRNNKIYNEILEHVSYEQGLLYLKEIMKLNKNFFKINKFKLECGAGNPKTYFYSGVGQLSPTTLRYIKVLLEIENLFDLSQVKNVCEIGAGYGGQARLFSELKSIGTYTIYDLPEVNSLIRKFLDKCLNNHSITTKSLPQIANLQHDLVISNYAFSELKKSVQDEYLTKVILKIPKGYMIYNHIYPKKNYSYTVQEISKLIPGSEVLDEIPLTHVNNKLLVWGHRQKI